MKALDFSSVELVADWSRDGNFSPIRAAHLVTFVTSDNARNGAPPKMTEFHYYERLIFGDYYDNKRDKTRCHFRYCVVDPALLSLPPERLVLQIRTKAECRQLRFSWVNGSLVTSPFIVVTDRRPPFIAGLTEIIMGHQSNPEYELSLYQRR
jgi:hypothetical protein